MKRSILIILMLCVFITACDNKKPNENKTSTTSTTQTNEVTEPTTSTTQQISINPTTSSSTTTTTKTTTSKLAITTTTKKVNKTIDGCWQIINSTDSYFTGYVIGDEYVKSKWPSYFDKKSSSYYKGSDYIFAGNEREGGFKKYSIVSSNASITKVKICNVSSYYTKDDSYACHRDDSCETHEFKWKSDDTFYDSTTKQDYKKISCTNFFEKSLELQC